MLKFIALALTCLISLSGCRYWVLYEFAEQFCEFEQFITVSLEDHTHASQVKIDFHEPVLNRHILLRYLNAQPFKSEVTYSKANGKPSFIHDEFAIHQSNIKGEKASEPLHFKLTYYKLNEHALLEKVYLNESLSTLFTPALIEPILRSLCSEDYDLSLKRLDMHFYLTSLPQQSLPSLSTLESIFGPAEETILDAHNRHTLRYEFDFLLQDTSKTWQPQQKPIVMLFSFNEENKLKRLYIQYHKYTYWLNIDTLSGRLLVKRRE